MLSNFIENILDILQKDSIFRKIACWLMYGLTILFMRKIVDNLNAKIPRFHQLKFKKCKSI